MSGTRVKLLTFDHNWVDGWYPQAVMTEGVGIYAGSAWHGYNGSATAMSDMHNSFPQKDIYFTEFSKR